MIGEMVRNCGPYGAFSSRFWPPLAFAAGAAPGQMVRNSRLYRGFSSRFSGGRWRLRSADEAERAGCRVAERFVPSRD